MKFNIQLVSVLIVSQILLWISYWYMFSTTKNIKIFWASINKDYHMYFLIMAGIAYLLNLILIIYYTFLKNIDKNNLHIITWCIIFYYGLQLLFLPFVKFLKPIFSQILLFMCVIPLFIIMTISIKEALLAKNILDKTILLVCSIIPFLHVLINDAILYGLNI